jgi:hypothetical protein
MGFGGILDAIKGVFGVVDELHTTEEERMALKVPLLTMQAEVVSALIDAEKAAMDAQAKVLIAESQSVHKLAAIWRPLTMLTFVGLIVIAQFGGPPVPEQMWPLLTIGITGMMGSRTLEKLAASASAAYQSRS